MDSGFRRKDGEGAGETVVAGKTVVLAKGLRGFRLSPERRRGGRGDGGDRKDGGDGAGGYVDSGFRRKDGEGAGETEGAGEGVTWIPAFAGKTVVMGRPLATNH